MSTPRQAVVSVDRSPMHANRWLVILACGHEVWLNAKHRPPMVECDACHGLGIATYDGRSMPERWYRIVGLLPVELIVCADCHVVTMRGFDWALERAGEPTITESTACAFAFHLGQLVGSSRKDVTPTTMGAGFILGAFWPFVSQGVT